MDERDVELDEAFFVLGCRADAAEAGTVQLVLTGARGGAVGEERLVIRTDDWDGIARAAHMALGRPAGQEECERRWARFAGRLQCAIAALDPEEFVVLQTPGRHFVQVMVEEDAIRVESDGDDHAALCRLGWTAPTHALDEDERHRHGSPNWWRDLPADSPADVVANLLIATLRQVHRVEEAEELTYLAATATGARVLLPTLGLSRAPAP